MARTRGLDRALGKVLGRVIRGRGTAEQEEALNVKGLLHPL